MAKRDPVVRDTKQRILDAALEVFGTHGFRGASVDDVAAAAGVTKGAVYYWFTDKDDLGRDLQHLLWEQLAAEALGALVDERSTVDNLIGCFEAFIGAVHSMPAARTFLYEAWFSPSLDAAGRAEQDAWLGTVRGLIQEGIDAGELVALDAHAMARVLVGALMEATVHALVTDDATPMIDVVRRVVGSLRTQSTETESAETRERI